MIGAVLSHYRVLAPLGEGGMGVVYRAQDLVLQRHVALKVLRADAVGDAARRARFLQEARSAAALNHPNIATIYEANEAEGTLFIAMELIEGESLRQRLARPLPVEEAVRVATDVAAGLEHAHRSRVVHRDLKPENVMLAYDGRAKILDFGLAKALRDESATDASLSNTSTIAVELTMHGQILGTPAYMSPEQARGLAVDFRTDLFSLGSILYEMLTGKKAFEGITPFDTLYSVVNATPAPPSTLDVRLPGNMDRIVTRCMRKDPEERWANTGELLEALRAVEARSAPAGRVAVRRARRVLRGRLGLGLAAAAVLVALGSWLQPWRPRTESGPRGGSPSPGGSPNWILVADFGGAGIKPDLAVATRELVTAALAQSGIVTPISHAQVLRGLRLAGKPDTTQVVAEVARELAVRTAARTYVEGRIDKVLTGYSIVLQVGDAESGANVVTVNAVAENDAAVITTLDRLGRELRERLGEHHDVVKATGNLRETITPSFDAYRSFVRAVELQRARKYPASNQELRQALALDGQFASAWKLMGTNYNNMGHLDSSRVAFDQALRWPDRLTESERLGLQVFVAYIVEYDLQKALDLYDVFARHPAFNADQASNRGTVLFGLGRYEEALQGQERAEEISPFGASELLLLNMHRTLIQIGQYDRARALHPRMTGTNRTLAELELAVSTSDWPAAERMAREDAIASNPALRFQASLVLASLQGLHGAVGEAARSLDRLVAEAPSPFWSDVTRVARVHLHLLAGVPLQREGSSADTTCAGWITRGIDAAADGDTVEARRCLSAVRSRGAAERRRYAVDALLLEAWIAAGQNRWDEVVQLLESVTTQGPGPWFVGRLPIRWLVAMAHERAGRLEEAASAYELVLSPERLHHDVWTWRALPWSFAHQRLAVLLARAGRADAARPHLAALEAAWNRSDASMQPLLAEARAASAALP